MSADRPLAAIVLAAGKGTRLKSGRPKVLHEICGRPLLAYSLEAAESLAPSRLVTVIAPDADEIRSRFEKRAELVALLNADVAPVDEGEVLSEAKQLENLLGEIPPLRRAHSHVSPVR